MYDYFMKIQEIINSLTLKQKLNQLFISGFEGDSPEKCHLFKKILEEGLGGVIFFTQNIKTEEQFKNIINEIKKNSLIPPFLSLDQEGGRVERTENIHGGKKYLSAKDSALKGELFAKEQTEIIANELKSYGINMNFAPVLDVNTNSDNPVIGNRAFSNNTDEVIRYSTIAINSYLGKKIIPVAKHFPGHGAASVDSHLDMPVIDIAFEELENIHIKPFKEAIENKIPAIMIAHVHYPAFDKEKIPSSVSKNIINTYLIKKLGFKGLIITDDMVMGGIKEFSSLEACIRAINAGINMFIFRDTDKNLINLIEKLENAAKNNIIDIRLIDNSLNKILTLKKEFNIL